MNRLVGCRLGGVAMLAGVMLAGGCDRPAEDTGSSSGATSTTTGSESTGSSTTGPTSPDGSSSGDPSGCPVEGVMGGEPGQIVPAVFANRCDGSSATLAELVCGHPLTLIDIGGAAFDICVAATEEYATGPEYDELQAKGLQIVQIFALDDNSNIPTTTFCTEYAEEHGVDFEFLIDQIGATHTLASEYPFNLVVDADGRVVHQWSAPLPDDKVEVLNTLLDAALEG